MMIFETQEMFQTFADRADLISQLLDIGAALSSTYDLGELLNLILTKSREITCSDAGSVYLVDQNDAIPKLLFKVAQNFSRPKVSFREFAIPLTHESLAGYVALTGKSLNLPDAYNLPAGVPYKLDRSFDINICYHTRSVLVLPMQNREGETIGVLQLINRKVKPDILVNQDNAETVTQVYTDWEERILRSLASQAAISIERNNLHNSIENLFEGFVKASVQIIEARDPTTSGHSERVAALTVRLSEELNNVNTGKLRRINFTNRQIQEIRYAALLHDFGKVGVPEAILSKQKKLYPDQLEIIRNRFALAQRTLQMECAQTKYQHLLQHSVVQNNHKQTDVTCPVCEQIQEIDTQLEEKIAKLNHYWNLIVETNEPRVLAEEPLEQLQELAKYTYRDIDGTLKPLITNEEMTQLIVRRGNLTPAERLAIEAHVTHSYEFLKRIPWTKPLQDIPTIAYAHHEKLDGSGYPRGLKTADIPIQTQIMTIADIYDALTAGDRPYKRGLSVQKALTILQTEAAHNKINTDFLEIFEHRQVFTALGHSLENELETA